MRGRAAMEPRARTEPRAGDGTARSTATAGPGVATARGGARTHDGDCGAGGKEGGGAHVRLQGRGGAIGEEDEEAGDDGAVQRWR